MLPIQALKGETPVRRGFVLRKPLTSAKKEYRRTASSAFFLGRKDKNPRRRILAKGKGKTLFKRERNCLYS